MKSLSLKHLAHEPMAALEALGSDAVERAHRPSRIRCRGPKKHLVIVGHQAKGITLPALLSDFLAKECQECYFCGQTSFSRVVVTGTVTNENAYDSEVILTPLPHT